MELLLTVEQAAVRLQSAPFTVRKHLREGRLRGIKRGRDWRIPESALTEVPQTSVTSIQPINPLSQALAMVRERDERKQVEMRSEGDSASDVRAVREAQTQ